MRRSMDEQPEGRGGRKKGAHYSAPDPEGPLPRKPAPGSRAARRVAMWAGIATLALAVAALFPGHAGLAVAGTRHDGTKRTEGSKRGGKRAETSGRADAAGSQSAAHAESDAKKTESQLQAVKSEIDRISKEVSTEQVERDRLTRELRASELSVGKARESLEDV